MEKTGLTKKVSSLRILVLAWMTQSADKETVDEFYHKHQGVLFTLFGQPLPG